MKAKRSRLRLLGAAGVACLGLALICAVFLCGRGGMAAMAGSNSAPAGKLRPHPSSGMQLAGRYGKLPLSFEVNRGQSAKEVKFLARGQGYVLFLTRDEAVLALRKPGRTPQQRRALSALSGRLQNTYDPLQLLRPETVFGTFLRVADASPVRGARAARDDRPRSTDAALALRLVGASSGARVSGLDELPGKCNYFLGNDPKKWRRNVPTYARVKYHGVYPGVDLTFYGNQQQLEHDFVVSAGADASRIGFRLEGSKEVSLDAAGDLMIVVEGGQIHFQRPLIYQEDGGVRREIAGGYVLKGAREVGFKGGAYDPTRALVIDPVLVYSTYLGGNSYDYGAGIAVDSLGNAYVTGSTIGFYYPPESDEDAFVAKLNPSGSALVYSTHLGGSNYDYGQGIAVDRGGNAYVTGYTGSSDFPTTSEAFQTTQPGLQNTFVTKLNPRGSALVYSTYLGGSNTDGGNGIALDSSGNAYVTGAASSSDFPTTAGAYQTLLAGTENAFVAKLAITPQAQIGNLREKVRSLVSDGELAPGAGQFLLAPLNDALVALDAGHPKAAIRDLEAFISDVQLLDILRRLRSVEGPIMIDWAKSIITALRG